MKKVNLKFPLINLDGTQIGDAGKVVAQFMVIENQGDAVKMYNQAVVFHQGGTIEVTEEELLELTQWISNCKALTVLVKGQILNYLHSVK